MYKLYLTILILIFSLTLACNNSAKSDRDDGAEQMESEKLEEVNKSKEEIKNQAAELKEKINDKIALIDSTMVDTDTSGLRSVREELIKEASEMDSVIYKTVNISSENWEENLQEMQNEIAEAESVIQKVDEL